MANARTPSITSPCSKQRLTIVLSIRRQSAISSVAARCSCESVTHIINGDFFFMLVSALVANSLASVASEAMMAGTEFRAKCCSIVARDFARRDCDGSACAAKGAAKLRTASRRSPRASATMACNAGSSDEGTNTSAKRKLLKLHPLCAQIS